MKQVYKVTGMTCGGCTAAVEKAINDQIPNIIVAANFAENTLTISGNAEPQQVAKIVEEAGFTFEGIIT